MSDSRDDAPLPTFAELAADPEIAALLDFEPAPRKVERPDGWTPELQRELIARIAHLGSPGHACDAIDKNLSGAKHLYRTDGADSFRGAWRAAVALAAERNRAARAAAVRYPDAVPGISRPVKSAAPSDDVDDPDPDPAPDSDSNEEDKLELIRRIGTKFLKKVAAERAARLAGDIVAADFYLRQVTSLEVMFDLAAAGLGRDPSEVMRSLRRDGHGVIDIVTTPFADWLDSCRREWWRSEGEPGRPLYPDLRFVEWHAAQGGYATRRPMYAAACADPPPGITADQWAAMDNAARQAAIDRIQAEDALAQAEWERRAHAEWAARDQAPPRKREGDRSA